ncbi:MAG TPA: LLM class flavin-dependent oxidoreductase, partial [Ktedonobacterales bacterium]|nr:LLM class flavin-dependent oxidoreductase [Ktedonobacterales bacterium]
MKLILHLNDFTWQVAPNQYGPTLAEIAWAAEAAGFERIGVADHVWQAPQAGGPEVPELECYTAMAFLAAHTSRAELMAVVTGAHFRNPGLLAKMVTTLDVLSGGRMWLGIGAGHYEEEARGLGIPFPPLAERFGWLDETLQICLRMWSGERGDERPF